MSKIKVVVDAHDLLVARTGIRTYILELIKVLEEECSEVDLKVLPKLEFVQSVGFFRSSRFGFLRSILFHLYTIFWKQFLLPVSVWRHSPNVLLCPDYLAPMWVLKAKKIVVFHDAFFWESPEHYNPLWLKYFKTLVKLGLRGDSHILTVSETSKKRIANYVNANVPLTHALTSFSARSRPRSPKPDISGPYFLHVGVFEKRKNLPFLIEAYSQFLASCGSDPPPKLLLVGSPGPKKDLDDTEQIQESIRLHDLERMVLCPGYLPEDVLASYYQHALAYLFPSLNEGFGLPVLEAFSYQIPVVVSDQEALMEVGGDAVQVAGMRDHQAWIRAMSALFNEKELRTRMIESGIIRLQAFNRSIFAAELKKIIGNEITDK